jgi:hypothetical protein
MYRDFFLIFIFFISANVFALEFDKINIEKYQKRILSEKEIRFFKKELPIIHLKIEKILVQEPWKEETLKEEVQKMFEKRKSIYTVFGFKDINFTNYGLTKTKLLKPVLTLFGSYKKINNRTIYFAERNIYYKDNFLQIKLLSEKEEINVSELDDIEKIIDVDHLEIK